MRRPSIGVMILGLVLLLAFAAPLSAGPYVKELVQSDVIGAAVPLTAERVEVELVAIHYALGRDLKEAEVTSSYRMVNRESHRVEVPVLVPLVPGSVSDQHQLGLLPRVLVDGEPATVIPADPLGVPASVRRAWERAAWGAPVIDPRSGDVSLGTLSEQEWIPPAYWLFTIKMEPGELRTVVVAQRQEPAWLHPDPNWRYPFLFLPPVLEARSGGPVHVEVAVPAPVFLAATVPLSREGEGSYRATLSDWPPEGLLLGVMSTRGVIPWVGDQRAFLHWVRLTVALLLGIALGLSILWLRGWAVALMALVGAPVLPFLFLFLGLEPLLHRLLATDLSNYYPFEGLVNLWTGLAATTTAYLVAGAGALLRWRRQPSAQ